MQIGINLPRSSARAWTVDSGRGVRRSKIKGQGHRRPKLYLDVWRGYIILDPLSRVDRGMQWATEILPLKRGWGWSVAHCSNCPPSPRLPDMRIADALVVKLTVWLSALVRLESQRYCDDFTCPWFHKRLSYTLYTQIALLSQAGHAMLRVCQ